MRSSDWDENNKFALTRVRWLARNITTATSDIKLIWRWGHCHGGAPNETVKLEIVFALTRAKYGVERTIDYEESSNGNGRMTWQQQVLLNVFARERKGIILASFQHLWHSPLNTLAQIDTCILFRTLFVRWKMVVFSNIYINRKCV